MFVCLSVLNQSSDTSSCLLNKTPVLHSLPPLVPPRYLSSNSANLYLHYSWSALPAHPSPLSADHHTQGGGGINDRSGRYYVTLAHESIDWIRNNHLVPGIVGFLPKLSATCTAPRTPLVITLHGGSSTGKLMAFKLNLFSHQECQTYLQIRSEWPQKGTNRGLSKIRCPFILNQLI